MYQIKNPSIIFMLAMVGIGTAIGCFVVVACMMISLIAANPWSTVLVFALFYALMAALIETGKI